MVSDHMIREAKKNHSHRVVSMSLCSDTSHHSKEPYQSQSAEQYFIEMYNLPQF